MRVWSPTFDMSSIPDHIFNSEMGRRRGSRPRKGYTGGVLWANHNPDTLRCRCAQCMEKRNEERAALAALPKRPRGRPPVERMEMAAAHPVGRPRKAPVEGPKRPQGRPRKTETPNNAT